MSSFPNVLSLIEVVAPRACASVHVTQHLVAQGTSEANGGCCTWHTGIFFFPFSSPSAFETNYGACLITLNETFQTNMPIGIDRRRKKNESPPHCDDVSPGC